MKKRKTLRKNDFSKQRRKRIKRRTKGRTKKRTKKRTQKRTKKKKSIRYKSKKIKQNKQSGGAVVLLGSYVGAGGIPEHLRHEISGEITPEDLTAFGRKISGDFTKVYLIFAAIGFFFHPIIAISDEQGLMDKNNRTYQFTSDTNTPTDTSIEGLNISLRHPESFLKIKALAYIGRFMEGGRGRAAASEFKSKLVGINFLELGDDYQYRRLTNNCQTYVNNAFQYLKGEGAEEEGADIYGRRSRQSQYVDTGDEEEGTPDLSVEGSPDLSVEGSPDLSVEGSPDLSVEGTDPPISYSRLSPTGFYPSIRWEKNTMLDIDLFTLPGGKSRAWRCIERMFDSEDEDGETGYYHESHDITTM